MNWYHALEIALRFLEIAIWPILILLILLFFRSEIRFILRNRDLNVPTPFGDISASSQPEPDEDEVEEASQIAEEDGPAAEEGEVDVEGWASQQRQIRLLRLQLYFERAAQWIFGSQLGLLFEIAEQEDRRVQITTIARWFTRYRNLVGAESAMSMDQWLEYLTDWNLIELDHGMAEVGLEQAMTGGEVEVLLGASLTEVGHTFVEYCRTRGYTSENFIN